MTPEEIEKAYQSIPEKIEDVSVRDEIREVFRDSNNGSPDYITKEGCLALAREGKLVWNAWREKFPVRDDFEGYSNYAQFDEVDFSDENNKGINFFGFVFGDGADFQKAQWGDYAQFQEAQWGDVANFQGAQWGDWANFHGAQWGNYTSFRGARWGDRANFHGAQWGNLAQFQGAQWGDWANFPGAWWGSHANFQGAMWGNDADFRGTQWGYWADFSGCGWEKLRRFFPSEDSFNQAQRWAKAMGLNPREINRIDFSGATFNGSVSFDNRKFTNTTLFSRLKEDLEVIRRDENGNPILKKNEKGELVFETKTLPKDSPTRFKKVPTFHGSEIHQDTSFAGAEFPKASRDKEAARAYRTLKLAFSRQQAIEEEQWFFRLEMAEEAKSAKWQRPLYWVYKWSSDYGSSVSRPFIVWVVLLFLFAPIYGDGLSFESLKVSMIRSLPGIGLDRMEYIDVGVCVWGLLKVIAIAIHKILSLALFFLIGLALRNRFKIK